MGKIEVIKFKTIHKSKKRWAVEVVYDGICPQDIRRYEYESIIN